MAPAGNSTQLVEVLDRVLDRGIVIDAEFRINVAGLALAGIEARIVVATIETYLEYADQLAGTAPASWRAEPERKPDLLPLWTVVDIDVRNRTRPFLKGLPEEEDID
jgi:gas vesicle structural protein